MAAERGVFEGDFSGMNETMSKGSYLTMPVFIERKGKKWKLRAGFNLSYLLSGKFEDRVYGGYIRKRDSLGEKVLVENATFDF